MHVRSLFLRDYRLYHEVSFEFSPEVNAIIGPNARGKTSLLEALYYLISGRSFRNAQQADLIREGAPYFYLEASFVQHEVEQRLKISCDGKERKIFYNNTPCTSVTSLLGLLKGVVMVPDDMALIKGSPNARRQFLDYQIAQVDPLYVHHLTRFMRAMRQRNCLLRAKQMETLDHWENEMASSAVYITQQRHQSLQELDEVCREKYEALSGSSTPLKLVYKAPAIQSEDLSNYFQDRYARLRQREMAAGYTLLGPHRDDVQILLDGREARLFASEGQQRTCVAAMRLAEWKRLRLVGAETPLMLMDDVGMSLDAARCRHLLRQLEGMGQVFLTATQALPVHGRILEL